MKEDRYIAVSESDWEAAKGDAKLPEAKPLLLATAERYACKLAERYGRALVLKVVPVSQYMRTVSFKDLGILK